MEEYPKMLYKCPGPVQHNDGISYQPFIVNDADEEQAALADGCELVVEDAWAKSQTDAETTETTEQESAELADLQKQAEELGIKVDGRWSAATLQEKINEALAK